MLRVYSCLTSQHDLRLVLLAGLVCALASFAAVNLLGHARRTENYMRRLWLAVAATASGFGIWATHFIAMLAYAPGIPSGYNIALTAVSLIAAIVLTAIGLGIALRDGLPGATWLGGATVGGGIAAMHYTGMAAFEVSGRIIWDPPLVVLSILLGALIGAASLPVALHRDSLKWKLGGALLLTIAICSHHFTAMGAVSIVPDGSIEVPPSAIPTGWLAVGVALASLGIILLACAGLAFDIRDRRHAEREADRMRGLANAAVEGLVISDSETIITVNNAFAALVGKEPQALAGAKLAGCFPDPAARRRLSARPNSVIETTLAQADGGGVPVELIMRPVDFGGMPSQAIAVRDLRDRKKAEQHISFLAHHDALTGLPNRVSFNKKLDQAIETLSGTGKRLAVLCLDLDRFKEVNDLFGHAAGDALLETVARRVTKILGPGQMMARLGGDEFAIMIPEMADPDVAGRLAENILEALRPESEQSTTTPFVSASIGIAVFPDDGADRTGLLSQADTALYKAKNEGRSTYRFFEASMGVQVRERRLIEHDLRQAIARRELSLVYQPLVHIETNEVFGFEALVRWHHPARGQITPDAFIPIAEESGLILHIGEWVIRAACAEAAKWKRPLSVAVNVSPIQIHNANFAQLVHEILIQTGLPPSRLELEITETALVRDLNRALVTLRQLKAMGVRIAMDDFGTGYSSLSTLRAFPFDKIKIDRSFVKSVDTNEATAAIIRAVLGLGKGLGLPVLAEGVETPGEFKFLQGAACSEAQGYLIGRPTRIEHLRHLTEGDAVPHARPHDTAEAHGWLRLVAGQERSKRIAGRGE